MKDNEGSAPAYSERSYGARDIATRPRNKSPALGNFYGGALVRSVDWKEVETALELKKEQLGLHKEVKW